MAVYFKNATVDVALPEGQADTQPAVSRSVHVQPSDGQVVYDAFGPDVTASFLLFDDPEAAPYYAVHGRVTYGGREYAISAPPRLWDVVPVAAHVMVPLMEIN